MKVLTIVGLVILIVISSCGQKTSSKQLIEKAKQNKAKFKSGIIIENGINRGISYTDSIGTDYAIRYIPIKITNDSLIPIHLKIVFSKEYNYPKSIDDEQFKVLPLPKEWTTDKEEVTTRMIDELPKLINKRSISRTLEPYEELVFAIGTIYPIPAKIAGVLPNKLFTIDNLNSYHTCQNSTNIIEPADSIFGIALKLKFDETCTIISCGQISYLER